MKRWLEANKKGVIVFICLIYFFGFVGFLIPAVSDLFLNLTKWALLISFILLLYFHAEKFDMKAIIIFSLIFLIGYFIEVLGVNSGLIFGDYKYGPGLGLKLFNTPFLIGINWLMLSYCFASIVQALKSPLIIKILGASAGMLIYDIIMEQSADFIQLWYWKDNIIPIQNYLAWFLIALIFVSILLALKIPLKNRLSKVLVINQAAFFLALAIYTQISI